jgi:hypothetical protein
LKGDLKMKKKFRVTFTQYWDYDVVVECDEDEDYYDVEDEAIALAEEKFEIAMLRPIAHTDYDEVEATEFG